MMPLESSVKGSLFFKDEWCFSRERAEILKSQMMMEGIEITRIRKALKGE